MRLYNRLIQLSLTLIFKKYKKYIKNIFKIKTNFIKHLVTYKNIIYL